MRVFAGFLQKIRQSPINMVWIKGGLQGGAILKTIATAYTY